MRYISATGSSGVYLRYPLFDFLRVIQDLQYRTIHAKRFTMFRILGVLGGSPPVPKVLKMPKRNEHWIRNSTSPPPKSLQQSPAELLSFPNAADDDSELSIINKWINLADQVLKSRKTA